MQNKVCFFIDSLDEGYTLTEGGKVKAFERSKNLEDYLLDRFRSAIEKFPTGGVNNMSIEIIVEENCPIVAN